MRYDGECTQNVSFMNEWRWRQYKMVTERRGELMERRRGLVWDEWWRRRIRGLERDIWRERERGETYIKRPIKAHRMRMLSWPWSGGRGRWSRWWRRRRRRSRVGSVSWSRWRWWRGTAAATITTGAVWFRTYGRCSGWWFGFTGSTASRNIAVDLGTTRWTCQGTSRSPIASGWGTWSA